jgi:hypothetical protein
MANMTAKSLPVCAEMGMGSAAVRTLPMEKDDMAGCGCTRAFHIPLHDDMVILYLLSSFIIPILLLLSLSFTTSPVYSNQYGGTEELHYDTYSPLDGFRSSACSASSIVMKNFFIHDAVTNWWKCRHVSSNDLWFRKKPIQPPNRDFNISLFG